MDGLKVDGVVFGERGVIMGGKESGVRVNLDWSRERSGRKY